MEERLEGTVVDMNEDGSTTVTEYPSEETQEYSPSEYNGGSMTLGDVGKVGLVIAVVGGVAYGGKKLFDKAKVKLAERKIKKSKETLEKAGYEVNEIELETYDEDDEVEAVEKIDPEVNPEPVKDETPKKNNKK